MLHVNYSSCNCYDCENKNKKFQKKKEKDLKENKIPYENKLSKDPIIPFYLECRDCPDGKMDFHKFGIPTSLGIRNGDFDSYFIDDNYQVFKKSIEPSTMNLEYIPYNENCWKKSYHPNFVKVDARDTKSYANLYDKEASINEVHNNGVLGYKSVKYVYTSTELDGRLVSVPNGGQIMTLDRPPLYETMPVNDSIYTDPRMSDYRTRVYKDYTDINSGARLYYLPNTHSDAFFGPIYTIPMEVEGILFKNPMNAVSPYYIRTPLSNYNVLDTKKNNYGELTWMRDSQEFREDLMTLQYSKINKKRYNPRYTGNKLFE
jgi:hypothetical protein